MSQIPTFFPHSTIFLSRANTLITTFFTLFLMVISHIALSQTGLLKGSVSDNADNPIEFATLSVFSSVDSSIIGGGISEIGGVFNIEIQNKPSYVVIDYLGFESLTLPITFAGKDCNLGNIVLRPDAITMEAVEVTAEKSTSQFLLDKKVFNVGSDLATRGGTAQEVLDNVPSLSVDVEGNVALRGSNNVRILINGKPSGLIGISGTSGLRNIQANQIERVEVITNPSARYDAEGSAGIINIVLKKDTSTGFNGSFDAIVGLPMQAGGGANINYKANALNFFASYNINRGTRPGGGFSYNEFYNGDTTRVTNLDRKMDRKGLNQSFRTGFDIYLPKKQTVTASFAVNKEDNDNVTSIFYRDNTFINVPPNRNDVVNQTRYELRLDNEKELEDKYEYALDYRKEFDKKDHTLAFNIQYQSNGEKENSIFNNAIYENDDFVAALQEQRSNNNEREKNLNVQTDYIIPVSQAVKLEFGQRTTLRDITNNYRVESLLDDIWTNEIGLTNDFKYQENVHAAYGIINHKFDKWSYQVGLRGELSDISTLLINSQEGYDSLYLNLFPSGFLSYELGTGNQVQASYSRRINRPRFRELNPFFTFSDNRNFFTGNPFLQPEITDSYEVGYLKFWEKSNLNTSLFYRRTRNNITRIRTVDEVNGTSLTRPLNIGMQENAGVEFLYGIDVFNWLKINAEASVFYFNYFGEDLPDQFKVSNVATTGRFNAKMTFKNGTDFQIRSNYRGPQDNPQGRRKSITSIDLGLSKDFLDNNMTVTLSVRDLLNQRKWRFEQFDQDFYVDGEFQWMRNSVTCAVNYRINRKKASDRDGRRDDFQGGGDF